MKRRCDRCRKLITFRSQIKLPRKFLCLGCQSKARVARKAERAARHKLKMGVRDTPYPKTDWKNNRADALNAQCECCGLPYTPRRIEHVHHLTPKRMAAKHGNPDARQNLLSVDFQCHGKLKALDNLILRNDWVGAVAKARELHVPLDRLVEAAHFYGFEIERLVF